MTQITEKVDSELDTNNLKVVFTNTSREPLNTVVRIAVPYTLKLPQLPSIRFENGVEMPMFHLKMVGDITRIYTVQGEFPPGPTPFTGEIVEGSQKDHESLSLGFSKWVSQDLAANVPKLIITADEVDITFNSGGDIKVANANKHCATFDLQSDIINGFSLREFLTIYSNLDHIEFKLGLNWHDRFKPDVSTNVSRIRMVCNNEFVIHFANQMQLQKATYSPMIDEWSVDLIPFPQVLRDGQGFEIRGYVLSMPESFINPADAEDKDTKARIKNLQAVRSGFNSLGGVGEVNAVHANLNHNNNWFNRNLPEFNEEWSQALRIPVVTSPGIFGTRAVGSAKTPGQTGAQQDFGADKGFHATVAHNPSWITYMKAGQVDRLRTFNVIEPDGSKVTKEKHPGWKTWNMETFDVLSTDTLGKAKMWRPQGTGWMGYDNQHRSQNGVLTYYALTGDELTYDTLLNCLEADLAQAPYGQADREVGRMSSCWAKMLRVLPSEGATQARLREHIKTKLDALSNQWRGRFPEIQGDPNRTVRVNQVIIDPRSNIRNPITGNLEPCWITYQCAQMCAGLYELSLVYSDPRLIPMIRDLARSFLWYGCFKEGNQWIPTLFVRYRTGLQSGGVISDNSIAPEEGLPLPASSYYTGNWEISLDISPQGWWNWVAPCVCIAGMLLEDSESKDRARDIINTVYPGGFASIESAEWFGVPLFRN
jgi:hypothetical protein